MATGPASPGVRSARREGCRLSDSADRLGKECVMICTPFASWGVPHGKRLLSRRRFLRAAAGTLSALGAGLLLPTRALAAGRDPKPMPGGFANPAGGPFIHANLPGPADAAPPNGSDPSLITDFDGFVGQA